MLYILRHGQTDWNLKHRTQGRTDIPLNETGRQMAIKAGEENKNIHFDLCYCSPLKRAKETAQLFLKGRDIEIRFDERLMEMSFGDYEGIPNAFETPGCPLYTLFHDPAHYKAQGGAEGFEELYRRTGEFMEEIIYPLLQKKQDILIVGHGAMNASIRCRLLNVPLEHFWDQLGKNCELFVWSQAIWES